MFLQLKNLTIATSGQIGAVRTWVDTPRDIFVLADVLEHDDWSESLVKLSISPIAADPSAIAPVEIKPFDITLLYQWRLEEAVRQHARLGFPIMATARGRAFIHVSGESSRIFEISQSLRRLSGFPAEYERFPVLAKDLRRRLATR